MVTIANKLYKTQIDANNYTINIDDYTIVTVKLIDFNNNPVANTNVTISCDKGEFYNNSKVVQQTLDYMYRTNKIIFSINQYSTKQTLKITLKHINTGQIYNITHDLIQNTDGGDIVFDINDVDSFEITKIDLTPVVDNGVLYTGLDDKIWGGSTDLNKLNLNKVNTITGITNNDGYVKFVYNASEWGPITLNANNTNIKLWVNGWREIELRQDIEYSIIPTEFQNNNPFSNIRIRYNNNINVVQLFINYHNTNAYSFPNNSAVIWFNLYTNNDKEESKIPHYLFNNNIYKYHKSSEPSVLYYTAIDPIRVVFRANNDYNDTSVTKITAKTGITFFFEQSYNYSGDN